MLNKPKTVKDGVEERLNDLEQFCYENKMPMFACVATDTDTFNAHMVSCAMVDVKLKTDKIADMACILRGFQAVPPTTPIDLDF